MDKLYKRKVETRAKKYIKKWLYFDGLPITVNYAKHLAEREIEIAIDATQDPFYTDVYNMVDEIKSI